MTNTVAVEAHEDQAQDAILAALNAQAQSEDHEGDNNDPVEIVVGEPTLANVERTRFYTVVEKAGRERFATRRVCHYFVMYDGNALGRHQVIDVIDRIVSLFYSQQEDVLLSGYQTEPYYHGA